MAYQGDGDVTAPLVYVNYGMPADYEALERLGVYVKGKIVIARYGAGWRGLKPKLAQEHGAVGCIIYSDPRDDGYSTDDVYPKGACAPGRSGFQRGSVADMTDLPRRPADARLRRDQGRQAPAAAQTPRPILKIPVLPISYGDAQALLEALDGPVAPRGLARRPADHLPRRARRRRGPPGGQFRLEPEADLRRHRHAQGLERPDEWVIRGNHRDGWVYRRLRPALRPRRDDGRGQGPGRAAARPAGSRSAPSSTPAGTPRSRCCSAPPNGPRPMPTS